MGRQMQGELSLERVAVCWIMHLTHCCAVPAPCQMSAALTGGSGLIVYQALCAPRILFCTYIQGKDRGNIPQIGWVNPPNERGWFFPPVSLPWCVVFSAWELFWRIREDQLWHSQALSCIFSSVTAVYVTLMCHHITLGSPAPQRVSLIPQSTLQLWLTALFEVHCAVWKADCWCGTHPPGIICLLWFQTQFQRKGIYCMETLEKTLMSHKTWPHKVRFRGILYLSFPKHKLRVCGSCSSMSPRFFQSVAVGEKGELIFSHQVSHLDTFS